MKAITIHQPYAHLIIAGGKQIETRSRNTNIRGRIAIHASKKKSKLSKCYKDIDYGAIIGTVELVDCIPVEKIINKLSVFELSAGDYSDGRYAWIMENPIKFKEPVFAKGKQGWWNWKGGEEYE